MNLHQVLTGAVNPGHSCFSVGSVGEHPFTAYASGCDIVILGTDFERLQIIPGAKYGNIQVGCVDCSMQQGKIAASYGNVICIFEPLQSLKQKNSHTELQYQWQKSGQISLECVVHNLTWDPIGSRLLTGSSCLQLWSNVNLENSSEDEHPEKADSQDWKIVWQCKTASQVHLMKFSPDGEFFATAGKLNLKPFRRGRRRSIALAHTGYLPHQQDPHEVHRNTPLQSNALCHFHIAASINPATDIPLLPSIMSLSLNENREKCGPFVVHWLNNKELHFTLSMEVFLQQFKRGLEHISSEANTEEANQMNAKCEEDADNSREDHRRNQEQKEVTGEKTVPHSSSVPLTSAIIDHEIEVQLSEWNKNADMLFSIHPMDGSLLVWHVDWLDEYQPGMFRQVQVSFVSRIPVAFPTGDANSLCRSIVMYACTKNVDLALQQGKQKPASLGRSCSMLISSGHSKSSNSLKLSIFTPNVMMISKHADGSLNQWLVSFAEESAFSTVLSISHKSRYCGHRFHLNDLACHSVLPLLLTTSHHNAIRTSVDSTKGTHDVLPSRRDNEDTGSTSQDLAAVYSELILWRVDPVGPLSFSGGVSELARINSLHVSAFSNVAWLPTLIPSYCLDETVHNYLLGAYCNSPSACFVASDGQYLRLYQAIIDAKKLLCELSNPGISHGGKMQLLHVFQEDFILNNYQNGLSGKNTTLHNSGYQKNAFSEKFYLIVIEYTQNSSLLHMWKLHLKSIPVSLDEKINSKASEVASQEELYSSLPDHEKLHCSFTQKYEACRENLQSTSQLSLSSERVYSQKLNLPEGVEIISIKPSAGHLSSSIYPVCRAPYLLATLCSDGKVRFWKCKVAQESDMACASENTTNSGVYVWEEWPLLIEDGFLSSSALNVPGKPLEISCAHTNRLAVAYRRMAPRNRRSSQDVLVNVAIFECESTGGSCWILEQTLYLDELNQTLDYLGIDNSSAADGNESIVPSTKHLVHLDWMSREDGSHILTVSIESKLYMFGQLAGKMQEQAGKEVCLQPLWENAKTSCSSRFVLLRCVDLVSSVEGSPPLPVSLSWVRDGILVVGMDCEMHVYSQWQPLSKQEPITVDSCSGSTPSITSLMKQSQPGSHPPKRTLTRSMTSLAQKLSGKRTVFDLSLEMEDSGLFEAAHALCPTLPQYHPLQLLELMDLGKVRRAKAILSHLVKCIAGEVIAINEGGPRRYRSLSICASGSTKTVSRTEALDYTEIDSVPPLPLYALLAADEECSYVCTEKSNNQKNLKKPDVPDENYDELFQNSSLHTDDLAVFEMDEEDKKPKVIDLSQYSPAYFGPEHAQVLSRHLLHSSLPGLTRMEQMSLMALADTIAITSTDIGESRDRNQDKIQGRSLKDTKMTQFFGHNFTEDRWRKAALKNAFSLLGKQRFEHSAAFFLLAGHLKDAVEVCLEKLNDIQLALVIARLYESEFEVSWTYKSVLQKRILGSKSRSKESPSSAHIDPFLRSMAYWILEDYSNALDTLISQPILDEEGENGLADEINLGERRLFFTAAYAHLKAGCPMLALEVLSKMPKVVKRSKTLGRTSSLMDTSKGSSPTSPVLEESKEDKSSSIDWSQPVVNGLGSSSDWSLDRHSDSALSFDWSQPSTVFQDEPLELKWDVDKDEESEDPGVVMKPLQETVITKPNEVSSSYTDTCSAAVENVLTASEDIIFAQLKFRACLKILTVELRTLSTGYEVDGGKLRYQLYHWLEREVVALQKTCDYNVESEDVQSGIAPIMDEASLNETTEELSDAQQRENSQRRQWLVKYQSLLRMFLSYCILHGSHGGGLASVRMELILLLQESQQIHVMHMLAASLSACIYQSLCGGHNCSSLQANQFTGTVYQTLLLSRQHSLRTASLDGTVTPNTAPAQWPASSPGDDTEKQQKRFRLSSKSSSKESSQTTLPSIEQDLPNYKEKFIPPELSIWDYFIAKPFLPTSQNKVEYDSEESQESSDDEEDWSLMRLAMVQLVLRNLKTFYPLAGHDLSELPVSSPLCHAVLKILQRWEQVLLRRLEMHGGPPDDFISVHTSEEASSSGPALLRHKALLEPTNTPFNDYPLHGVESHVLCGRFCDGSVKELRIYACFRLLKEGKAASLEDQSESFKSTSAEEPGINKANRNCIAIASSHDIQELDVSGILSTHIYAWVDDDLEMEAKGSDDFLVINARDDLTNIQGTTPYTHSNPGTPINMPWLGSTQTGRGAAVMIKKAINNVRRMASHPTLPYYLTGAQDGSVRMFEWGHSQQITCFRSSGNSRITRMRFNYQGNKTWQCHNKTANDFVFISSSSLIVTAGQSTDNRNICLWDTLVSPSSSLVHAFTCHDSGATVLAYAPKHQLLLSGGRKGYICVIDLHQKQQRQFFQSHDSQVKAIAVDPTEEYFVTGSAEGNVKVWSLSNFSLLHTFINEHSRQSIFRNLGTGVMQIETGPANHIFSCGADGTVKMRILPDRFSSFSDVLKNDVKLML
ncbi:hypothetical protein lerEdw1_000248 [Lerista edwardsae]|nr:hypothetical protein lerEdw1_000248 [Lerista edwardsae]